MPLWSIRHSLSLALRWLKESRLDGIIFVSNDECSQRAETSQWTRQWINEVANELMPD